MCSHMTIRRRRAPLKVHIPAPLSVVTPAGSSRFQEDFDAPFFEGFIGLDPSSKTTSTSPSQSRQSLSSYDEVHSPALSPTSIISSWSSVSWRSSTGDRFKEWVKHPIKKLRQSHGKLDRSKDSDFGESHYSLQNRQPDEARPTENLELGANIPEAWWKLTPCD